MISKTNQFDSKSLENTPYPKEWKKYQKKRLIFRSILPMQNFYNSFIGEFRMGFKV